MPGTIASRPRPQRTREATRPVGNWNSFTENSATQHRTHSAANEILTAASEDVHHDAKGNTTLIPPALRPHSVPLSISWDFDNKLRAADTDNDGTDDLFYKWDALGRRIGRDDGTTNVVYFQDGQQTLADYTSGAAASSPTYTYAYGSYIDEVVLRSGSSMHYYHRNQQYSVVALSDGGGSVAERYAYSAYGEPLFFDGSGVVQTGSNNRYTYTGREWDAELSLYHYRARMYDPVAGRFVGREPIGYLDGNNLYGAYFVPKKLDWSGRQTIGGRGRGDDDGGMIGGSGPEFPFGPPPTFPENVTPAEPVELTPTPVEPPIFFPPPNIPPGGGDAGDLQDWLEKIIKENAKRRLRERYKEELDELECKAKSLLPWNHPEPFPPPYNPNGPDPRGPGDANPFDIDWHWKLKPNEIGGGVIITW